MVRLELSMRRLAPLLLLVLSIACLAQDAPTGQQGRPSGERRHMMGRGVAGTITAISKDAITLKTMEGSTATVKVSDSTQFRRDREPAKLADFSVGDTVFVGGESAGANTWDAKFVAKRTAGARGPEGGAANFREQLGKRFIAGEITKIDETRLTIKRVDGETQVIEADENTSFRNDKRESITLADIKVGDKIFGRGELKNDIFVPATLNVGDMPMMRRGPGGEGRSFPDAGPERPSPEKQ